MSDTEAAAGCGPERAVTAHAGPSPGPAPAAESSVDAAFTAYVSTRQHALVRTAYLLTGDHHAAEDLVQATLARVFVSWRRIRDRGAIDAYVRRTMINEHTTWWRRAWRRRERSTDIVPEPRIGDGPAPTVPSTTASASGVAEHPELWALLRDLAPRQRAVVVLRYYEDLSEAQIAEALGCSIGTVKSQASRALATLRSGLSRYAGAEGGEDR